MSRDELYEELSRLLADDLPADRAATLRARIEGEVEVARAWAEIQQLAAALDDLPAEEPLPARVVQELASPPHARRHDRTDRNMLRWGAWAVAACLALALIWPRHRAAPELVLGYGQEFVDGHVNVLAGDLRIEVDGSASIRVEPPAGVARVSRQEVMEMDRKTLLSAFAGAAVTVAVIEGYALISDAGDDPFRVEAGDTRTVGTPAIAAARTTAPGRDDAPAPSTDLATASPEELLAEIDRLRAENDGLRLQSSVARGVVDHYEGVVQPWPDAVPAPFRPDAFPDAMREAVAEMEDAELLDVDCEEFPCVAMIRTTTEHSDWARAVEEGLPAASDLGHDGPVGLSLWAHGTRGDEGEVRLVGVAYTPRDLHDEDVQQRTDFRATQLFEDLSGELLEPEGGGEGAQ
jgi:hypothetical protein